MSGVHWHKTERAKHFVHNWEFSGHTRTRKGPFARNGTALHAKRRLVCKTCNNGWMSRLENRMRLKMLRTLKSGRLALDPADLKPLRAWLGLKAIMMTYSILQTEAAPAPKLAEHYFNKARLSPLESLSVPAELTIAVMEMTPPFQWGGHNLVHAAGISLDTRTNHAEPFVNFAFAGQVGPIGFIASNLKNALTTITAVESRNPALMRVLAPESTSNLPRPLTPTQWEVVENLLFDLSGRPANFMHNRQFS